MNTGYLNSDLLSDGHKSRASERLGADLCRLFGLDPARYSPAFLRGAAMATAQLLGRSYAMNEAMTFDTPDEQHSITLFTESLHGA